ncbi:hypothetical protein [Eubacterium ramulus]|uniref:hypothetical protein n=1 Tax=Eubacterium ramulus TaxID=39490 RepID=UPI003993673D
MFIGNKKCRIYAACGVSQTPNYKYTCEELLDTLKAMNFAEIQEQGFIPLYKREAITNDLHEACGFRTDYQFITKSRMKTIQKKSKRKE